MPQYHIYVKLLFQLVNICRFDEIPQQQQQMYTKAHTKRETRKTKTYLHLCMPIYNYQCLFNRLNLKALIRGQNIQDKNTKIQKTHDEQRENRLNFYSILLIFFLLLSIRKLQRHFFSFSSFHEISKYVQVFLCFAHFFGRLEQINNRHELLISKCVLKTHWKRIFCCCFSSLFLFSILIHFRLIGCSSELYIFHSISTFSFLLAQRICMAHRFLLIELRLHKFVQRVMNAQYDKRNEEDFLHRMINNEKCSKLEREDKSASTAHYILFK